MNKKYNGPYYNSSELARLLGVSKNTLIRWEEDGTIPKPLRDGRGWRVWTKDALETILEIKRSKELKKDPLTTNDRTRLRVNVIGYGNQGAVWAKNLRDSGVVVTVLLREGSSSIKKALDDGFEVKSIKDGLLNPDSKVFCVLMPDEDHKKFFDKYSSIIDPEFVFIFAHGFSVSYEGIKLNARKILLAPKSVARTMRMNYLDDKNTPAVIYTESVKDKNIAIELAKGLKLYPLIRSTFLEETLSDLFTEQMIICGGVPALIVETFNMLKEKGISEEVALQECLYELSYMLDVIKEKGISGMYEAISPVAASGGFKIWEEMEKGRSIKEIMHNAFDDIKTKKFLSTLGGSSKKNIAEQIRKRSKHFDSAVQSFS